MQRRGDEPSFLVAKTAVDRVDADFPGQAGRPRIGHRPSLATHIEAQPLLLDPRTQVGQDLPGVANRQVEVGHQMPTEVGPKGIVEVILSCVARLFARQWIRGAEIRATIASSVPD